MSANATGAGRTSAARGEPVPNAATDLPRPGEACARHASRGDGPPSAPDISRENSRERNTAAAVQRAAGGWRARGRGSAGASVWRPACVPAAENESPRRAPPSASPAGRRGAQPRGSSTPKGAPGGDAAGAEERFSRGLRRALRAPRGMTNAVRERTPRAGSAIAAEGPGRFAWTARRRRTERRGARRARRDRITPRESTRECRSFRRASPWSS